MTEPSGSGQERAARSDGRPLLFCYDGSKHAAEAIRRAATLVRARPAIVLHVHHEEPYTGISETGRRIALEAGFDRVSVADAGPGRVAETIIEQALRSDAAAIVAGSHGRSANDAAVLGSVSSALVHRSSVPVLVARLEAPEPAPPASEPIFICYDGSDEARRAITIAAEVLVGRAAIVAAFVPAVDDVVVLRSNLPWPAGHEIEERLARIDRKEAEAPSARAAEGVDAAAAAGLEPRADALGGEGAAWERMRDEAAREAAACIVVGHRSAVNPLASTAGRLVHHADRPVLVVPGPSDT
jgi:nucleotide-binding universal stress UspA family protein